MALSQVDTVTWYLGGGTDMEGYSAETYYTFERGTDVYSGRQANWQGKVGLMYPSDYAYTYAYGVNDQCYSDADNCDDGIPSSSWLYNGDDQWLISPYSNRADFVFVAYGTGYVRYNLYGTTSQFAVRPVVHLRSDVKLTGSGTSTDPYKIVN